MRHQGQATAANMDQEDFKSRRAKRRHDAAAKGSGLTGACEAVQDKDRKQGEANGGVAVTNKRKRKLRQKAAGDDAQRVLLAGGGEAEAAQQANQRATDASAAGVKPRRDPPRINQVRSTALLQAVADLFLAQEGCPWLAACRGAGSAREVVYCVAGCAWFGDREHADDGASDRGGGPAGAHGRRVLHR